MFGRSASTPQAPAGKIFISYRRRDSEVVAHRIYDRLRQDFGPEAAFIDIDKMPFADFRAHIAEQVRKARVVLVVIGPEWLRSVQEGAGRADDWVRVEIETALAAGVPVAPVRIGGVAMPGADELPPSIAQLAYINALTVSPAEDFHPHMDRLAGRLAETFGFERRIGAPGVVKARPATAELVVASRFASPLLPPPRAGERWEAVVWPKAVDRSWTTAIGRLFGEPKFAPTGAAWTKPGYNRQGLAVTDGRRIGFVDFASKEFELDRPFTSKESFLKIGNLVANGEDIVFATGRHVCKYSGGGNLCRDDLWSVGEEALHDEPEWHTISGENSKGWWLHIGVDRALAKPSLVYGAFCDVYSAGKRLTRYTGEEIPISGGLSPFIWSLSGNYGIVHNMSFPTNFVTTKDIDSFRFERFSSDSGKLIALPAPCNDFFGGVAWHPTLDVFALSTYRQETVGDRGASRALDWHIALYGASDKRLLDSVAIDEPRQLDVIAWNATGGRYLAAGGRGRCIFVWDLLTGSVRKLFGHTDSISSLDFSPDGQRLLSSGGGQCIVWNPETGERIASWPGFVNFEHISEGPWSPDATMVATSGFAVRRLVV